mmetsp:Transcript_51713/g.122512  ORF Transcript_51713/g.122512 Transcript_51713/m.122512 type:complete len:257 (+) Transcript_51713:61-831(+)
MISGKMSYGAVPEADAMGKNMQAPVAGEGWEADAKRGFLTKVYSILSVQLLFTVVCCAVCMYVEPVAGFMAHQGMPVFWFAFAGTIGSIIGLYFYKTSHPTNLQLLAAFTLFESMLVGTICAQYQAKGVECAAEGLACANLGHLIWIAWGITFVIFASLTAFVVFSKIDFSFMGMFLFAGSIIMMGWALISMLFGFQTTFLFGACGAALMSGYIIYDTHQIMNRMGPDDYVIACVELYTDIITLFIYILDMLSARN